MTTTAKEWRDSLNLEEIDLICEVVDRTPKGETEDWWQPEDIRERRGTAMSATTKPPPLPEVNRAYRRRAEQFGQLRLPETTEETERAACPDKENDRDDDDGA